MNSKRATTGLRLILGGLCVTLPVWYSISVSKNPVWPVFTITLLGVSYGTLLYKVRLPSCLISAGMLLFLAVFLILASRGRPFGTTCANWLGGYPAVAAVARKTRKATVKSKAVENESKWRVNGESFPNVSSVKRAARARLAALDGKNRYIVTVTMGFARLDLVGSAVDGLVVYCSPDARLEDKWSILLNPNANRSVLDVRMGPNVAHLPNDNVVPLDLAYHVLEDFVAYLSPSAKFDWLAGVEAFNRRPTFLIESDY